MTMLRLPLAALATVATFAGACTTTTFHPRGSTVPQAVRGRAVIPVARAPGVTRHAPVIAAARLDATGTAGVAWHDIHGMPIDDDAFAEVRVERVDHLRGAFEGAAVGLAIGGAMALAVAVAPDDAANESRCEGNPCLPAPVVGALVGIYIGIPLTVVGALIGGARGHRYVDVYAGDLPRIVVLPSSNGVAASAAWRF